MKILIKCFYDPKEVTVWFVVVTSLVGDDVTVRSNINSNSSWISFVDINKLGFTVNRTVRVILTTEITLHIYL